MLVGREAELRRIRGWLGEPLSPGQLRMIQVEGPMGIGKSTVLADVLSRLGPSPHQAAGAPRWQSFLVHGGRWHGEAPLAAHRVLIEQVLGAPIEELLAEATAATLGARCAERLGAAGGSIVVAVDDAQWLEPASITFLTAFLQTPAAVALTVILAHRVGQAPRTLLTTARSRGAVVERLVLAPLPDEAMALLARDLRPAQRHAVVAAAEGNPLFARTAVAAFRRYPAAEHLQEVMQLGTGDHADVLSAAIADDMAALAPHARGVLEALALLGHAADTTTLARVTALAPAEVMDALRLLKQRGLLMGHGHEVLHPMVRLSVYQHLSPSRRAELHGRAARLPGLELFERADHLAQVVPDLGPAEVDTLVRAARVAIGSEPEAVVTWLGGLGPDQHTPESTTLLARGKKLTGNLSAAIGLLRTLVAAQPQATEARVVLANAFRMAGQADDARALLAATADRVDAELLREYIDVVALLEGRAPEKLISRLESLPGEVNQIVAAIYRTMDLLADGRVPHARTTFRPVPTWMRTAKGVEIAAVLHAVACGVWAAYLLDQYEAGAHMAHRGITLAHRYGQADVLPNLNTARCFCLASLGLLDEADTAGKQAIDDAHRYGAPDLVSMALTGLLIAAQGRGDQQLLQHRLERLNAAPLPRFGWWRRAVLTTRTRVSAALGRPVACPELLGEPRDAMAALRHADAATAAAALGEVNTAFFLIAQGIEIAEEQESHGQHAMLLTTQAEILLRAGDALKASNLLRDAADTFQRLGMRLQLGRAHAGIARAEADLAQRSALLTELTKREREITELVAQGLTNREIAERLVVSPRTPEYHIRNVLKKLGLRSREEITALIDSRSAGQRGET